jgi:hypothetical protein
MKAKDEGNGNGHVNDAHLKVAATKSTAKPTTHASLHSAVRMGT